VTISTYDQYNPSTLYVSYSVACSDIQWNLITLPSLICQIRFLLSCHTWVWVRFAFYQFKPPFSPLAFTTTWEVSPSARLSRHIATDCRALNLSVLPIGMQWVADTIGISFPPQCCLTDSDILAMNTLQPDQHSGEEEEEGDWRHRTSQTGKQCEQHINELTAAEDTINCHIMHWFCVRFITDTIFDLWLFKINWNSC